MQSEPINQIIESCIESNHRAILVLKTQKLLAKVYQLLNEHTVGPRPQLVYLYQKRLEKIELNASDVIDYVKFNESDVILGNTISMLVIQDFDAVTPNLLAKAIETVRGGGICCFIIDHMKNTPFHARLLKYLSKSDNVYFFDDSNNFIKKKSGKNSSMNKKNVLELKKITISDSIFEADKKIDQITKHEFINKNTHPETFLSTNDHQGKDSKSSAQENQDLHSEIEENIKKSLFSLAKTRDQLSSLNEFDKILTERNFRTVCSLTAARGRGKSAVLGLIISLALHYSFTTINVAAPLLENVKTVFEFIILGLKALGYQEKVHFNIFSRNVNKARLTWKISFRKRFIRQQVTYLDPAAPVKYLPDLLVIDEAAAVPIPILQKLLAANLVMMASTVDGYEGTGRALVLKLFAELEQKSKNKTEPFVFHRLCLDTPVRYGIDDPIEKWLNKTLVLYARPKKINVFPQASECQLHVVNVDTLFSGAKTSEIFLGQIVSVLTASHYKNTPDDLLRISENKNSTLYVLSPKLTESEIPDVICVIETVDEQIQNLRNKQGNLTQHCLFENYQNPNVLKMKGKRVLRISVHPDMQRMGYGKHSMNLLIKYISQQNELNASCNSRDEYDLSNSNHRITCRENQFNTGSQETEAKAVNYGHQKNTTFKPLLSTLEFSAYHRCDYISVSFGATNPLLAFWKPLGFVPMHLKAHTNLITGDFSTLFVLPFSNDSLFSSISNLFKNKFVINCSSFYREMDYVLAFNIFYSNNLSITNRGTIREIDSYDKQLLSLFINGKVEYRHIAHVISQIALNYFFGGFVITLSPIEQSILFLLGLQHRKIEEIDIILEIEHYKIISKLLGSVSKLYFNKKA